MRRFLKVLAALLLIPILLVVAGYVALQTPSGRDFARRQALRIVNAQLQGQIEVEGLQRLSLWELRLRGVRVLDPAGKEVGRLEQVSIDYDPLQLLTGRVQLSQVQARNGYIELAPEAADRGLMAALNSRDPPPPDNDDAPYGGPSIHVEALQLDDIDVRIIRPDQDDFTLAGMQVRGTLAYDGELRIQLAKAQAQLQRNDEAVGALTKLEGTIHTEPGQPSHADLQARVGPTTLSLVGRWAIPEADTPLELPLKVTLRVDNLRAETWRLLGMDTPAERQRTPVDVQAALAGTLADARLEVAAVTTYGRLELDGRAQDLRDFDVTLRVEQLRMAEVVEGLPEHEVDGRLTAQVTLAEDAPHTVHAQLRALRIDEEVIPSLDIAARLAEQEAFLDRLTAPFLEGELDLSGRIGFDGSAELNLRARIPQLEQEAHLRQIAAGVRGGIEADVQFRLRPDDRVRSEGRLVLRQFALLDMARIRRVTIEGSVQGELSAPVVNARVDAHAMRIGELTLDRVNLRADGGPQRYRMQAQIAAAPAHGSLHATLQRRADDLIVSVRGRAEELAERTWTLNAPNVRVRLEERIVLPVLRVQAGVARLRAAGQYNWAGPSTLRAEVRNLDLDLITQMLDQPTMPGRIHADLDFTGTPEQPAGTLEARYVDGMTIADVPLHVRLDARLDAPNRQAGLKLWADAGDALSARVAMDSQLARMPALEEAWMRGYHDIHVVADHASAAALQDVGIPGLEDAEGSLQAQLRAEGTQTHFSAFTHLRGRLQRPEDPSPLDVAFEADYRDAQLRTDAVIVDDLGPLLDAQAVLGFEIRLFQDDAPAVGRMLVTAPWDLHTTLHSRRLDELPGIPQQYRDELPVRLALEGSLRGGGQQLPEGRMVASVDWDMPVPDDAPVLDPLTEALGPSCAEDSRPGMRVQAALRDGHFDVIMAGHTRGQQVLDGTFSGRIREGATAHDPPALGSLEGLLRAEALALRDVPVICEHAAGVVSSELQAENLLSASPSVDLQLTAQRFSLAGAETVDIALNAAASAQTLQVRGEVTHADEPRARFQAVMPVRWQADQAGPEILPDAPLQGDVFLAKLPLQPLMRGVPGIGYVRGNVSGEARLAGTLEAPEYGGHIELDGISLTLVELAQPIDNMRGTLRFEQQDVVIEQLHAEDRNGVVTLNGRARIDADDWAADLDLRARNFPVRHGGAIVAEVGGRAQITATSEEELLQLQIDLRDLVVWLRDDPTPDVQELERRADIFFVDEDPAVPAREPDIGPTLRASIGLNAPEPFWVHGPDFSAQLTTSLQFDITPEAARMVGPIELRRGFFSLMGKTFDLERSEMRFTGAEPPDPALDVTASHVVAGRRVSVQITGHLSAPELSFLIDGSPTTSGEALALLTGRATPTNGEVSAQGEAASFLAGVTTGFLTLGARRRLHGLVPVLAIEPGATPGATRVRAGVQADRLIPAFLRGIVRGAYVEGIFAGGPDPVETAQPGAAGAAGGGVLIELQFPYDLVGTGAYGPGQTWSIDVTWEP